MQNQVKSNRTLTVVFGSAMALTVLMISAWMDRRVTHRIVDHIEARLKGNR